MTYLLDASTLVEVLRAVPSQALVQRLSQVRPQERYTSAIGVSQLLLAARQDGDPRLMQQVVRVVSAIRVAPYDLGAAQSFAKFRATVAPDADVDDVMLAAVAVSGGHTLVTRRDDVFAIYPKLRTEDWTKS
jgi:tRNA(fMet)-specific endonuclease VapC